MSESSRSSGPWSWGRAFLVVACLIGGLAVGYAYYLQAPKVYQASATVLVLPTATGLDAGTTGTSAEINMDTEAELARSVSVATQVSDALSGELSSSDLLGDGAVTIPLNSQVLQFSAQAPSASLAADAANEWAQTYLDRRSERAAELVGSATETLLARYEAAQAELEDLGTSTDQLDRARRDVLISKISDIDKQLVALGVSPADAGTIISEAEPPSDAAAPQLAVSLGAGLIIGAAVAAALILVGAVRRRPEAGRRAPTTERQVRVLASLSGLADDARGSDSEELRRACQEIVAFAGDPGAIAVVGVSDHGTTVTVALQLSQAWASEIGRSVVVSTDTSAIDALPDGVGDSPGLRELLVGAATPAQCATRTAPTARAVVVGPGHESTVETVSGHRYLTVWDQLENEFGTVLAATTSPEASIGEVVIRTAGRVVGIVSSGHGREQDLTEVLHALDRLSATSRLVGVIIVDDGGLSGTQHEATKNADRHEPEVAQDGDSHERRGSDQEGRPTRSPFLERA